ASKAFTGKTGNGPFADMLAEMDTNSGRILDEISALGIENDTIVIFSSDNGPEDTIPWRGWAGPWTGTYVTAMEGSLRVPFIIRWPGKVPADRVSNEMVHEVDLLHDAGKNRRGRYPDRPRHRRPGPDRVPSRQAGEIGARVVPRLPGRRRGGRPTSMR